MMVSLDIWRGSRTATNGSGEEKYLYIRGERVVGINEGGKYGVADNLGIDSEQRRRRLK